jgi:hypothetical protein
MNPQTAQRTRRLITLIAWLAVGSYAYSRTHDALLALIVPGVGLATWGIAGFVNIILRKQIGRKESGPQVQAKENQMSRGE